MESSTSASSIAGPDPNGGVPLSAATEPIVEPARARSTAELGMFAFLASDLMVFAALFAAYFLLRSNNTPWPPEDVDLDVARAGVATAVLVASSVTMVISERALARSDLRLVRRWLLVTLTLGGVFLANQLAEYRSLDFGIDSHVYGSTYWGLTGLHSLHVTAGLAALGLLFVRATRVPSTNSIAPWMSATAAFWHLVDIVWVFVFSSIWLIQ